MGRDEALLKAFGDELRSRRTNARLSQEELASLAEVNRTYVAKLELAQNQPTLGVLYRLACALKGDLPDLLKATLNRYKCDPAARK